MYESTVVFTGSKSTITNVIISGCDNQPICPLKKNTNVTFEVDFTSSKKYFIDRDLKVD